MKQWLRSRQGKILMLGSLCLLLQQISVPYSMQVMGLPEPAASLLHRHAAGHRHAGT